MEETVERLTIKSFGKSKEKFNVLQQSLSGEKSQEQLISISLSDGIEFIQIKNIIRIKSGSNYSTLYMTSERPLVVSKLFKDFEEMLLGYRFYRVHNSHLINLSLMSRYMKGEGGQIIMQNGDVIDVSRRKKDDFLRIISNTGIL